MTNVAPTILSTVSSQFIDDWLTALRTLCPEAQMASLLARSGLVADTRHPHGRVTLDQIVCLYQLAAIETGDEMMGHAGLLCSFGTALRPARPAPEPAAWASSS